MSEVFQGIAISNMNQKSIFHPGTLNVFQLQIIAHATPKLVLHQWWEWLSLSDCKMAKGRELKESFTRM